MYTDNSHPVLNDEEYILDKFKEYCMNISPSLEKELDDTREVLQHSSLTYREDDIKAYESAWCRLVVDFTTWLLCDVYARNQVKEGKE